VKLRLCATALFVAVLLSGCSTTEQTVPVLEEPKAQIESPAATPEEQVEPGVAPSAKQSTAPAAPSAEQKNELIDSIPAEKSLAGLKTHFQEIDAAASSLEPFKIEYTIGPTAVPSKVESVVSKFSDKLKMYQLLGLDSLNQDWVLASENDHDWWVDFRKAQDPRFPVEMWDKKSNVLGHCGLSSDVFCGAGNSLNGKNYQDNVVGTRFTNRGLDYVSRHESAHFYQAVFGYGGKCWMAEGQATFFETYLESTSRSRSDVIARLKTSTTGITNLSKNQLLSLLESDQVCQKDSNIAYDLGMLGYEYLYLNFSFLDVHDLQVASSTKGWDKAVTTVLSVDPANLNRDLAEYIYSETR
jgi:hypothetical protein